jgi:hypothetical protein
MRDEEEAMRTSLSAVVALAAASLAFPIEGVAQEERIWRPPEGGRADAEVVLYRETDYDGPSIRIQTAVPDLGLDWNSLRGMASEFFTHPASNGRRILACRRGNASSDCARDTAARFCRARGYGYIGNVAMQSVSGRVYLADVLCKRSAS